jgi:acetyltransferase
VSVRNIDRVLAPERVAVIGASTDPGSVGGIVLDNLASGTFDGIVNPVNPNHPAVHGIEAYPSVAALQAVPDLAVICTPAPTVNAIVRECGAAGVAGVVVVSSGFREAGDEGAAREQELVAIVNEFDGMRLIGPNCLGFIVPSLGLNASFARTSVQPGQVGLISQSGALATSILDWAEEQGIGFSAVVSAGNMADVDFGDLIDYFGEDPRTQALILYVESVTDPRKFMSAARAFARRRPIVAYKAGRFPQSAAAAVSHTGAMAGADDVYDAAFRRAGIERVAEINEIFDAVELLGRAKRPHGASLAVVTNAGGPGVMAADALLQRGGTLAEPSVETLSELDAALPESWSHANPADVLGDARPDRYVAAMRPLLADPSVDALLVLLTPQAMSDPTPTADAVAREAAQTRKPVLTAWMGGAAVHEGRQRLESAGIPSYETPEQAVGAFMHLVSFARNQEILHETPRAIPVTFELDRARVRDLLSGVFMEEAGTLSEAASKTLLDAYGIPVTRPLAARSPGEAVEAAERLGYPVVLKVRSPEVTHKSDIGGVIANIQTGAGVRTAYERIEASLAERRPSARFDGVSVQEMVTAPGHELIVGARKDPTFGAVIMVGAGGLAAELMGDVALELPPLNERLATRMLEQLRVWPLLRGYRGRPGANLDHVLEVMIRFSYLVADYPEIAEVEINPLLATTERAVALDARVVLDPDVLRRPMPAFSHLAIRPYPEELTTQADMTDGTPITLRPIKPEDEPMWHELLAASSPESIRARFRALFGRSTHQMASRYCFIDYDRELAIVAEIAEDGNRKIAGVGRLVADADRREAEYAVLVADPWQGRGLANLLMDRCLEIARAWGLERVWAETDPDNARMLAVFRSRGFKLDRDVPDDNVVHASLELAS